MGFWGTAGNVGRVGLGASTLGLSEYVMPNHGMFGQTRGNNEFRDVGPRSDYQLPGFQGQYKFLGDQANQFERRQAPQSQSFMGSAGSFRNRQDALSQQLMADSQGNGPTQQIVRMQAQDAANRAGQQQMAMANSARPGMGGMAYRNAAMNMGNAQSAVGGQAAMAGMQGQLGAMGQYAQFLDGARGQDQQLHMFNAGQAQNASQFNVDAQLRQLGLNDESQLEALRQRLQAAQYQQQGGQAYQAARGQRFNALTQTPTATENFLGYGQGLANVAMKAGGMGA